MPDDARPSALLPLSAVPTLPRVPLLESLPWALHREGFMAAMLEWAERHRGVGIFRFSQPGGYQPFFVGDVALAEDLVDEARFEKALDGPVSNIREFAGDGLFTARNDEESWHVAHRILAPGFSMESLGRYFPAMVETLDALVAHWRRAQGPVDVVSDMTRLTLDSISLAGFDHRFESFGRSELHPFLQSLSRALQESADVLQRPPLLAPLFRRRRALHERDIASMFALVDEVLRARRAMPAERWPRDFLSLMLAARDPKTGLVMTEENIRYQLLTFLVAGHETTAGLLSFALHALARDPALFARVRAEVDAGLPRGEAPTPRAVLGLDLVRRVLSEALRLWPTVPAISRAAREDTSLGGRYVAPKGQPFWLLLNAVHRDPAVWHEPSRFDPDRFLPEAVKARPAAAYKPFGVGKRACTGRHFAMLEATLALATLAREFDLEQPAPLRIAPTLSPKPLRFGLRVRPRGGARE